MSFEGMTACVVGASMGIGRRTAERLLEAGASVGLLARSAAPIEELAARHPDRAIALRADATDPAAVSHAFHRLEERFGGCDLLVSCAGLVEPRLLVETTPEQWDRSVRANLHSVFLVVKRALAPMIVRGSGSIVCVASISGVHGTEKFPGLVPYCASKAGVIGLVEAVAAEIRDTGVRINAVSPGSVDTEMLRQASPDAVPAMTTDEVADTILFLLSDRSRPIQGQNLHVWGV